MESATTKMPTRPEPHGKTTSAAVYFILSTHWDREWYEPFQGFRYRLVNMLDETLGLMERGTKPSHFQMDGQSIPIEDYLEIRPERADLVRRLAGEGRLAIGPWYVQPDEFIPSGESLVRNLAEGLRVASQFGIPSRCGFLCDIFGHNGQMPQILRGFEIDNAFVWRGTNESRVGSHFRWQSPDGSEVLTYRFGPTWGYGDFTYRMRAPFQQEKPLDRQHVLQKMREYCQLQAARGAAGLPIMLFDGSDHLELEPDLLDLIGADSLDVGESKISMGVLDDFAAEMRCRQSLIHKRLIGELREPGQLCHGDSIKEPWCPNADSVWLIPGVLSSRIPLKQANARCESLLLQWAEPFSTFAAWQGLGYPEGFLRVAWRHLLANHAHDSICGCSIDQVHQDMQYRFDQAELIGTRLTRAALVSLAQNAVARAAADECAPRYVALFNACSVALNQPLDFNIEVDAQWPVFNEFFGYEPKPAFTLEDEAGDEIPYQRLGQAMQQQRFKVVPRKFPNGYRVNAIQVATHVEIPAFGFRLLGIRPAQTPTRYGGSRMACGPRVMENEFLRVEVTPGGLLMVTDKRTGQRYENLLELEDCADIGDGWFHGLATNDRVYHSGVLAANVAIVADGPYLATLRVEVDWPLPGTFDFQTMQRASDVHCLHVMHEITLRAGVPRIEITTQLENLVQDHRLRVLFPSGILAETYLADCCFDAVRRPISINNRSLSWRELELDTKPQHTWTCVHDADHGLAVVSTGLPESAVLDQPQRSIALTLLRSFKKAVFTDGQPGGQIQGFHKFQYWIVPLAEKPQPAMLSRLGQQLAAGVGQVQLVTADIQVPKAMVAGNESNLENGIGQPDCGMLHISGAVVVTAVRANEAGQMVVRCFNPADSPAVCSVRPAQPLQRAWRVNLEETVQAELAVRDGQVDLEVAPHAIVTLLLD